MDRRDFVRIIGLGMTGLLTGGTAFKHSKAGTLPISNLNRSSFAPDIELSLRAAPSEVAIYSGNATRVWSYQGEVLRGDSTNLQNIANSYLGPIIRAHKGQNVRINFTNNLPEQTVLHWHGLSVPPEMDAHPRYLVGTGQTYIYEFQVKNRAGTYWFHPHPDGRTGQQVYNGLAGLLIVSDDEEMALALPTGDDDIPLVIQDRTFNAGNQLVYTQSGMMNMDGFLGDRILVNGQSNFSLPVVKRAYRLRLLNGSNSRIYKLAWDDGTPLTVIATDGGLLERPAQRSYVMLAPGERVEVLADFRKRSVGDQFKLVSLQFSGIDSGGMGGGQALPNGSPFTILNVQVKRKKKGSFTLPEKLSTIARHRLEDAINKSNPRVFAISGGMMQWLLNGRTFEMDEVADNEIVRLDTLETWEVVNQSSGGMMGMGMAHPLHIHGLQFQIIERQIAPQFASGYETVRYGYVDEGWKDTVMLMPGERAKLLLKFENYPGMYVYHCHNLEHEDRGMMRNYLVRA